MGRDDLTDADRALIAAAQGVVDRQYVRGWNTVGAALRTTDGRTYAAIHLDADVGRIAVCAEAIALGMAVSAEDRLIESIVAVMPDGDGWAIIPPCGMCREMLSDYAPDAVVILTDGQGRVVKRTVRELLPEKSYGAYPALDHPEDVGRSN